MAVYKAIKANMIPTTWEHDAVYYIKTGDYAETYVTDSNGNPFPVGNSGMINALIAAAGGADSTIIATAGSNLSGGRVVYISAGKAYYFDPTNEALAGFTLGITKGAALQDDDVQIQIVGIFEEAGLGLAADTKYFIGSNGILTNNISGLKVVQQAGVSIDANKLAIHFYSPIITI